MKTSTIASQCFELALSSFIFMCLAFLLWNPNLFAQTPVSGTIAGQNWTKEKSPYIVVGDIRVGSLTIQPGTKILFDGNYLFEVAGILSAIGTEQDSIVFTKKDGTSGWRGIFFNRVAPGSGLAYCRISYSTSRGITIDSSSPTIRNCTIANNSISGFREGGGGIATNAPLTLTSCTISSNIVSTSGIYSNSWGGGIYSTATGALNLTNCIVQKNSTSGGGSGHFESGGGLLCEGTNYLRNCIISDNYAGSRGGGIEVFSGTTTIVNCTIAYNTNGGIFRADATVTVMNSILFFNTGAQVSGDVTITYSDVQNNHPGHGNINFNPVFLNRTGLMIVQGSPCIDAGNPNSSYLDACFPPSLGTTRNDMGAYGGPCGCCWIGQPCGKPTIIDDTFADGQKDFSLAQNHPNPFNPSTTISFDLPRASAVTLKIFDLVGHEVATLAKQRMQAGRYSFKWDASGMPGGVYFYRLQTETFTQTRKLLLLR